MSGHSPIPLYVISSLFPYFNDDITWFHAQRPPIRCLPLVNPSRSRLFSPFTTGLGTKCNGFCFNVFENDTFEYYPNPTSDIVTFNLKNTATKIDSIEVMDVLGKTLLTKTNHYSAAAIDLSSLSKGMYLVKVKANGQEKTVKITKN